MLFTPQLNCYERATQSHFLQRQSMGWVLMQPIHLRCGRVFSVKGRSVDHLLIIHIADASQMTEWARDIPLRLPCHVSLVTGLQRLQLIVAAGYAQLSPASAQHMRNDELGAQVGMILDGRACRVGLESTIVSLVMDKVILLRSGGRHLLHIMHRQRRWSCTQTKRYA